MTTPPRKGRRGPPETPAERSKRWRTEDPRNPLLSAAKARARAKGLLFSLRKEDIQIPIFCPVLGILLCTADGRATDHSPSLDRIVPHKGYVPGNVRVISLRANRIKADANAGELKAVLEYVTNCTKRRRR